MSGKGYVDILSVDLSTLLVQGESVAEQLRGAPAGAFGSVSVERLAGGLEQQVVSGREVELRRGLAEGDWDDARYDIGVVFADIFPWRQHLRDTLGAAQPADPVLRLQVDATLTTLASRTRYPGPTLDWMIATNPAIRAQTYVLRGAVDALSAALEAQEALAATGGPSVSAQDLNARDILRDALMDLDLAGDLAARAARAIEALKVATEARAKAAAEHDLARNELRITIRRVRALWGPAMARAKTLAPLDLTYASGASARRREEGAETPPDPSEPIDRPGEPVTTPSESVTTPSEPVTTPSEPVTTPSEPCDNPSDGLTISSEVIVHVVS